MCQAGISAGRALVPCRAHRQLALPPCLVPRAFLPSAPWEGSSAIGDLPKEVSGLWLLLHGAGAGQVMEGGQGPPEVVLCGVGLL